MQVERSGIAAITAASRGIGFAVAEEMARCSDQVIITSGNRENIEHAASVLQRHGARTIPVESDMTSASSCEAFLEKIENAGRLDSLIFNFGDPRLADFTDLSLDDWDSSINMFLRTPIRILRETIPYLEKTQGSIVFITSMTTREAFRGFSISGSLRAALVNLSKTLSIELGPRGIRSNCISQGYFLTERLSGVVKRNAEITGNGQDKELKAISESIPLRRVGKPEEIGKLVRFLCSRDSSYITGTNIPIDGGLTGFPY